MMGTRALARISATDNPSGSIIDIDDIKNVKIKEVENYGATGSLTIINKGIENPATNILSDDCALWNDGRHRALKTGMFIRIFENERTSNKAVGVYMITKIQAIGETINVQFGDAIQLLRATGADYVRNHYDPAGLGWHNTKAIWDSDNNRGYVEKPEDIQIPSTGAVRIYTNATRVINRQYNAGFGLAAGSLTCKIPTAPFIATGAKYLRQLKNIQLRSAGIYDEWVTIKVGTTRGSSDIAYGNFRMGSSYTWNSKKIDGEVDLTTIDYIWIELSSDNYIITITDAGDFEGATCGDDNNRAISMDVVVQRLRTNVVGNTDTAESKKWIIQTIEGVAPTSDDCQGWPGQAQIQYVDDTSKIPAIDIIGKILSDAKMELNDAGVITREVNIFRCNGDYYHNYILALCDMPSDLGRQLVVMADRYVWGRITVAYRFMIDNPETADAPRAALYYVKDGPIPDGIVMAEFNPTLSLQQKPRLAVVKGTTNAERPIMVAISDPDIEIGAALPVVESSVTNAVEAGLAAYKNVITNRSKNWSGTITIAGIDRRFFTEPTGFLAGGIPIEITDHRYGMDAKIARVREIEMDYGNQKTTITVNNYSEIYSNGLVDTEKMAYKAGELSAESTNTDMFNRQFVSVENDAAPPSSVTSVEIYGPGSYSESATGADVTVIQFPELGTTVVNAYFPPGHDCGEQYGIKQIGINGTSARIAIPESRRPDRQNPQALIVNLIYTNSE